MLDLEHDLLRDTPEWGLLLAEYARLHADEPTIPLAEPEPTESEEGASEPTGMRWFNRLMHVPGVAAENLSRIHGRLIALGWLKIQLENSEVGLQYRLAPEGRSALAKYEPPAHDQDSHGDEPDADIAHVDEADAAVVDATAN